VDRLDFYLKLIEINEEVRNHLITLVGGSKEFALLIARDLGFEMKGKDAAAVLGLSESGSRKRIKKIKGKKAAKIVSKVTENGPKVTRKRPSRKGAE
jgi:hypothetical protein